MGQVLSIHERLAARKRREAMLHLLRINAGKVKGRWKPIGLFFTPVDAEGNDLDIRLMTPEEQQDYLEAFEQQDKIAERRKQITLIHSKKDHDEERS